MTGGDELIRMTARQVVALLDRREVSPLELIDAALARIDAVDGAVNALPVRCPERARDRARRLMAQTPPAPGTRRGWLAGLRSTHGSPIFANHVPGRSDLQVEALERNGGVVLARSNAPEFAAGANTFNEVFGRTLNPWNTAMSCGGSSGGSAVALATGEVWLANGSDLGGSLRIPASFCSVVGLRPGAGVVPHGPDPTAFDGLAVAGPMARNVADAALMLDAMAVFDPRDPHSQEPPREGYLDAALAPEAPRRIGFSADLGFLPVEPEVRDVAGAAAQRFSERGVAVEEAAPDFAGAGEIFQTLRALRFVAAYAPLLAEQRYVEVVAGRRFDNYVDWLGMSYAVTLTGCPALSLPCGFTRAGLPVGLQLVGRPRGERALLAAAALLEAQLGLAALLPIAPRPPRG